MTEIVIAVAVAVVLLPLMVVILANWLYFVRCGIESVKDAWKGQ